MKLKIKKVNENNIAKPITEIAGMVSDAHKGMAIKAIEAINKRINDDVTSAGYKCKSISSTDLYIIPQFGYLSELVVSAVEDSIDDFSNLNILVKDCHGDHIPVGGKTLKTITYDELENLVDDIGIAMAKTLIAPSSFANPSESLTEDAILEYGPLSAIKGIFGKAKDALDKFAASNQEKHDGKRIFKYLQTELTKAFEEAIAKLLEGGKSYVKVESKVEANKLTISLKSDFVTAISFKPDAADPRRVKVAKLLTPLGEVKAAGKSVDEALRMIGKVLDIDFTDLDSEEEIEILFDEEMPKSDEENGEVSKSDSKQDGADENGDETSAAEDEASKDAGAKSSNDNIWKNLIGDEAFSELSESYISIDEELSRVLSEAYTLKIDANKYKKALDKVKNADAEIALVKYFLLKETGGALSDAAANKIEFGVADAIADIIKKEGTFNPNVSFSLMYILNYIKANKEINRLAVDLSTKLPNSCKNEKILTNMDSVVYKKGLLFNSSKDVKVLSELLDYRYSENGTFSKDNLKKLAAKPLEEREELVNKFDLPKSFLKLDASKPLAMRKALIYAADGKKFKELRAIEAIEEEIDKILNIKKADPDAKRDAEVKAAVKNNPQAIIDRCANDVDNIDEKDLQGLLTIATQKGLKDAAMKKKIATAVLQALGNSN